MLSPHVRFGTFPLSVPTKLLYAYIHFNELVGLFKNSRA
jgi:hypothetical protein